MRIGTSLRSRHFVVRLERGEELINSLKNFVSRERARTCCFTGHGYFSKCQIQNYFPDRHSIENQFSCDHFSSVPFLSGNITTLGSEFVVATYGVVSFDICGQQNTLTGIISSAKVFDLELHITIFDDLNVVRSMDDITGLLSITRISNEDYISNMKNSSAFGSSAEIPIANSSDSDVPSISGISSVTQNPVPEIIHRGLMTGFDNSDENRSAKDCTDAKAEIKNLDTASTNLKRRRRVSANNENDKSGVSMSMSGNHGCETPNSMNKPESRKRASAVFIPSEDKSLAMEGRSVVLKDSPIVDSRIVNKPSRDEDGVKGYRRRTSTFKELSGIEENDTPELSVGSWVIHPSLGLCKVIALLKNDCVQIKPEVGSARDISLSYFKLVKINDVQDRSCFRLERI